MRDNDSLHIWPQKYAVLRYGQKLGKHAIQITFVGDRKFT